MVAVLGVCIDDRNRSHATATVDARLYMNAKNLKISNTLLLFAVARYLFGAHRTQHTRTCSRLFPLPISIFWMENKNFHLSAQRVFVFGVIWHQRFAIKSDRQKIWNENEIFLSLSFSLALSHSLCPLLCRYAIPKYFFIINSSANLIQDINHFSSMPIRCNGLWYILCAVGSCMNGFMCRYIRWLRLALTLKNGK